MKTIPLLFVIALAVTAEEEPWKAELATAVASTEGPAVDKAGNVYFADLANDRIMKLNVDGSVGVYRDHANLANGMVVDAQDRLITCHTSFWEHDGVKLKGQARITRTDLKTGKIEVIAENYEGKPFYRPNDVTLDGKGRIYFTDNAANAPAVYRIDGPGKITRILSAPDVVRPNGITISPKDDILYLIEASSAKGGLRMVRAWDLSPEGTVKNMRVVYNFYPGRGGDGMSIDVEGNLYVAAGLNSGRGNEHETLDNKAGVYVISPAGKLIKFIPVPEDPITNNTFGGPDMKTLYVTVGKGLYKFRTEIAGMPR